MTRERWARAVWAGGALWTAFLLASLQTGWLNQFFYDTDHSPMPGIDFYSVARGWQNLLAGRSEFDTFSSSYGPYATWLNYHPALVLAVGAPLMIFSPRIAYGSWIVISAVILLMAGLIVSTRGSDPVRRACVMLLLLGSFPTFILWQSGNVQAVLVLAVSLIFAALDGLRKDPAQNRYQRMLLSGLLISMFSKPIVLTMLPLLLLLRNTRRTAAVSIAIYLPVSWLSLVMGAWNPVALSWSERWVWLSHPQEIARTMNVYTNGFTLTRPMLDNAVHWFSMVGLTDFRFLHIDIYSLSALLDGWLGTHTPDALYRVPILLVLEATALVAFARSRRTQMEAALMVTMAASLLLILSYGVVWEYHYTLVLPIAALLLVRGCAGLVERFVVGLGVMSWLPSLYVLLRSKDIGSLHVQTILRAERVLPIVAIFLLLLGRAVALTLRDPAGLRLITRPSSSPAA